MSKLYRALRTFDTASLTGSYQDIGAVVPFVVTKAIFINDSDVHVLITDGSSQEDLQIPDGQQVKIEEGHNATGTRRNTDDCVFLKNTQLQIKQFTGAGTGYIVILLLGID